MNPLLIIGGAAAIILLLLGRRTHAMVRRGSPYDRAGGSSFTPPPRDQGAPPPDAGNGFSAAPGAGDQRFGGLGDDLRGTAPSRRGGIQQVERGSALRRQRELRDVMKAKARDGDTFGAISAQTGTALGINPADTDAWLAAFNEFDNVNMAMSSYNYWAGDVLNRWSQLGVVFPGWTKDLGWAGGLTAAEQTKLIEMANANLSTGASPGDRISEKQMLPVLQTAFARATSHPINDIKTNDTNVKPLVDQYLLAIQESPEGTLTRWPTQAMIDEADALAKNAWDSMATQYLGTPPPYSALAPAFKRRLRQIAFPAIASGQLLNFWAWGAELQQYVEQQAAISLQNIYDEFPGITPDEAKEKLQAELGLDIDNLENTYSEAQGYVNQGSDAIDSLKGLFG